MADYHVYAGLFGIYAGKTKKNNTEWIEKSEVTDEAICAVRDCLYDKANVSENKIHTIDWKRKDGKIVKLILKIEDGENNK